MGGLPVNLSDAQVHPLATHHGGELARPALIWWHLNN